MKNWKVKYWVFITFVIAALLIGFYFEFLGGEVEMLVFIQGFIVCTILWIAAALFGYWLIAN